MSTLTKADLADALHAELGGFSKREALDTVDTLFGLLRARLGAGESVKLSGFGNFAVRFKRPRVGRNPLTGEEMEISARHVVTFKPSPALKDRVNGAPAAPKKKRR